MAHYTVLVTCQAPRELLEFAVTFPIMTAINKIELSPLQINYI